MTYDKYRQLFDQVLNGELTRVPYNDPAFVEYTKLNKSRHDRWMKRGELDNEMEQKIREINSNQQWVLISEPWCGDAAHLTPFMKKLADLNPKIDLIIQLRDEDSEIDDYLTNGGKSIPILVVRDENRKDLFHWGPRPEPAQQIHLKNRASDRPAEEKKMELQNWYNRDKGQTFQQELLKLFNQY